ncbi:hypothetical protein ACN4FU_05630 [Aliarcobacter butzleri]|uniref:hypothetical protein n=1 Tax=Aliarcobacter butzleri TaxID=28197 RepID=UPI003AF7F4AC
MANSLREVSEKETIKITEFRIVLNHIKKDNDKVLILVEGNTDIKFFRKIFNTDYSIVKELNGKDKIKNILNALLNDFNNVFGIRDLDFDKLESYENSKNLFLTDYHDFEVEMIESDAFNAIIDEHSNNQCHANYLCNLKDNIYSIALIIGYLRWFNERTYKATSSHILLFDGLKFEDFIQLNNCRLELIADVFYDKLLIHSKTKNSALSLTKEDIINTIDELKKISTDKLQICSGHDLTEIISIALNKRINRKNIESNLRVAYKFDYFKNTQLHKKIEDWNKEYNYKLFN